MAEERSEPVYHLHVENLTLGGALNAEHVRVDTLIKQRNIRQTNITGSTINKLTIPGNAEGDNDENLPEAKDHPLSAEHGEQMITSKDIREHANPNDMFNSKDWTKLSGSLYMFKTTPLRPNTDVYRGKQMHLSGRAREVVVKLLKETDYCIREVDILLKLKDHPNIVKILESGELGDGPVPQIFIVLEYCLKNLKEYIADNTFNLPRAISFFHQTVSAIAFIHDNNITHRDLKPSNILISLDGNSAKVSDFGISREITGDRSNVTVTHPGAGTEGFRPPEAYREKPEVSYKGDIFSLGICGCIIMTHGKHPFGDNPYLWPVNIMLNKGCDLSQLPQFPQPLAFKRYQLVELVQSMLEPNSEDRPRALRVYEDVFFKGQDDVLIGLQKQATKLMKNSKFRDASELLQQLYYTEGSDKLNVSLQMAECEMRLKSDKVETSIQRVHDSTPKSCTAEDAALKALQLNQDNYYVRALVLLRIAYEIRRMDSFSPDNNANWIGDIVYYMYVTSRPLALSGDNASHDIAMNYGVEYMKKLSRHLRSLVLASDDVIKSNEARCQNNICAIKSVK